MPRVSVIVPVYNSERTIGECVESIFALSFPRNDVELLLIDNASSDRTSTILDRYRDRAIILHEATRGPAAARNRGLLAATGDIVAFTLAKLPQLLETRCRGALRWAHDRHARLDGSRWSFKCGHPASTGTSTRITSL